MVLRKMLDKFRSRGEPKKGSEEPVKSNSSKQQQDGGLQGGGDSKKKLKKMRSVRVADLDGLRKAPKKTSHLPLSKPSQQGEPPAPKATAEAPNYMKSTSSYDARKEKHKVTIDSLTPTTKIKSAQISTNPATSKPLSSAARALVKNSSLKLLRSSMTKNTSRATCSSTIKDSKTPESVDLNEDGDALEFKVCPYTFCSLHGHKHAAVPSLKRFLPARRQSLKARKSMKLRGYSSMKKKGDKEIELVEDVVNELFIEIHSKLQAQTLQQEWGEERSEDEIEIKNIVNRMNKTKLKDPNDASLLLQESCSVTSFEDCGDKNSELSMEDIQVINQFLEYIEKGCQEETQFETGKSEQAESESNLSSFLQSRYVNSSENKHLQSNLVLPHSPQGSVEEEWTIEAGCGEQQEDASKANLNNFAGENNVKDDDVHAQQHNTTKVKDCSSLVNMSKVKYGKLRRQPTKFRESVKEFNPRLPRLLALQVEPEPEQVNLKHQTVDEKKAAEEWMIDYALRKALRRLAPARKRKVPLLVAAFETVMPQMCETLLCCDASANIGPRPAQT